MVGWLNSNAGMLTAISTIALVFATILYVWLTHRLLKASYRPEVVVYLRKRSNSADSYESYETIICVKNVGTGVARKIKFGDDLSFAPYGGDSLEKIDFLKYGIDCLGPGEERRQVEPYVQNRHGDLNQLKVSINVVCEDSNGEEYSYRYDLNFEESDLPSF